MKFNPIFYTNLIIFNNQPRIPILIKSISSEYLPPMEFPSSEVMPQKRSAMLINKFMKDVQRAFENFPSDDNGGSNGLQARDGGQNSEDSDRNESKKKFTRCYLNAASCFY